jgi:hypothetical protein
MYIVRIFVFCFFLPEFLNSFLLGLCVCVCFFLFAQGLPEFMFANRAGLEMFETTAGVLQDLSWENTLDENSKKFPYTDFTQVLQQVRVFDPLDFQNQQMNHTFFEGWEFGIIYLCTCINRRGANLSCRALF